MHKAFGVIHTHTHTHHPLCIHLVPYLSIFLPLPLPLSSASPLFSLLSSLFSLDRKHTPLSTSHTHTHTPSTLHPSCSLSIHLSPSPSPSLLRLSSLLSSLFSLLS